MSHRNEQFEPDENQTAGEPDQFSSSADFRQAGDAEPGTAQAEATPVEGEQSGPDQTETAQSQYGSPKSSASEQFEGESQPIGRDEPLSGEDAGQTGFDASDPRGDANGDVTQTDGGGGSYGAEQPERSRTDSSERGGTGALGTSTIEDPIAGEGGSYGAEQPEGSRTASFGAAAGDEVSGQEAAKGSDTSDFYSSGSYGDGGQRPVQSFAHDEPDTAEEGPEPQQGPGGEDDYGIGDGSQQGK
ncbi:hypothetical protein [Zhihengliuella sp.]|uniref:hypothetical protein n=1 Tax=Zhihengliuella sp. TaxID=1954483 RepID=UPI002810E735|nr:hypothetical protein [Zhihengliuella sp.]